MRIEEPPQWHKKQLQELVSFQKGRVVTTDPYETTGALPYIGAENFGGVLTLYTKDPMVVVCEPTDILMLWDGERSGLCSKNLQGAIGSTVARLRPRSSIDGGYLYHQLTRYFPWIQARRTGTGVPHVPKDLARILWIPFPNDEEEQRRISGVLDTVDEAISKTEAVIAKLRQVRAGLLHDLLTRGLDENGELRDPEQFKDSPLGKIPREWRVESLWVECARHGGSIQTGPFGSQLHDEDYVTDGTPIITVEHLGEGEIIHANLPRVSEKDRLRLNRYLLRKGDLVFSRVGAIDRCALVSAFEDGWLFSGRCLRVRPGSNGVNSEYLSLQLNSYWSRRWIRNHAVGSTMQCLNTMILSNLPIAVPPPKEQEAIAVTLSSHDEILRLEQTRLSKLASIKNGLMSDLLTGRVRVPENLEFAK